jgi:hypothetical protein
MVTALQMAMRMQAGPRLQATASPQDMTSGVSADIVLLS